MLKATMCVMFVIKGKESESIVENITAYAHGEHQLWHGLMTYIYEGRKQDFDSYCVVKIPRVEKSKAKNVGIYAEIIDEPIDI